jgi:hypothetical protein
MILLFVLPCLAEMAGAPQGALALVEMGSGELFAQVGLKL